MKACHKQSKIDLLFAALRRRWHTYGDMLDLKISTSPWRRLTADESHLHLKPGEKVQRKTRADGLVMVRIGRG